jgi:hypothetical protein
MGHTEPMVNIRMQSTQLATIQQAAEASEQSRSGWCREVLLAAATSGRTLDQIVTLLDQADRPFNTKTPAALGAHIRLTGKCLHPVHLIKRYPTRDVCTCGDVVATR